MKNEDAFAMSCVSCQANQSVNTDSDFKNMRKSVFLLFDHVNCSVMKWSSAGTIFNVGLEFRIIFIINQNVGVV